MHDKKVKNILVIDNSIKCYGAEKSLYQLLDSIGSIKVDFIIAKNGRNNLKSSYTANSLPFIWFYKSYNVVYLFKLLVNLIICSRKLVKLIKKHEIDIIYANTVKSLIYGILPKILTKRKLIFHIRDNCKKSWIYRLMIRFCDENICISKHIYNMVPEKSVKKLIYGGVDMNVSLDKKEQESGTERSVICVGLISQLTKWKNHMDFIRVAKIITDKYQYVHCVIVGKTLSKKDEQYKKELNNFILDLDLGEKVSFSGYQTDINIVISNIDILIHTAINEPFGRVLVEAMAMEKPVVAYNSGGPKEIIINNETGYLVETYNYIQLAEKTIKLIEDKDLRRNLGKAGRQRAIQEFNINRYVTQMEQVFEDI